MKAPDPPEKPIRPEAMPHRRRVPKTLVWIAALVLVLIGIRAAMPPVILHFANKKINQIPEYRGRIGDVDLALFRGAYQIRNVRLEKIQGTSSVPFFTADLTDLSVEWG